MTRTQPDSERSEVERVLDATRRIPDINGRIESISGRFLGCPYATNLLIGSADTPEVFTGSVRAFDCVTYIETVLAMAGARTWKEFVSRLRDIRYDRGRIAWRSRNHYMTNWIRNNVRAGLVQAIAQDSQTRRKERVLDMVPGLPPQTQRFRCIPKRAVSRIAGSLQSGDLIFFASTRPHLDVFHCGIVIREGEHILLRHASRSQGGVVEQDLSSFLDSNRMAGVILVRPSGPNGR